MRCGLRRSQYRAPQVKLWFRQVFRLNGTPRLSHVPMAGPLTCRRKNPAVRAGEQQARPATFARGCVRTCAPFLRGSGLWSWAPVCFAAAGARPKPPIVIWSWQVSQRLLPVRVCRESPVMGNLCGGQITVQSVRSVKLHIGGCLSPAS